MGFYPETYIVYLHNSDDTADTGMRDISSYRNHNTHNWLMLAIKILNNEFRFSILYCNKKPIHELDHKQFRYPWTITNVGNPRPVSNMPTDCAQTH